MLCFVVELHRARRAEHDSPNSAVTVTSGGTLDLNCLAGNRGRGHRRGFPDVYPRVMVLAETVGGTAVTSVVVVNVAMTRR
jgi:hypothetical protein